MKNLNPNSSLLIPNQEEMEQYFLDIISRDIIRLPKDSSPDEIQRALRVIFRLLRERSNIDQGELAEHLGTIQQQISLVETGRRKMSQNLLLQYEKYFGVVFDDAIHDAVKCTLATANIPRPSDAIMKELSAIIATKHIMLPQHINRDQGIVGILYLLRMSKCLSMDKLSKKLGIKPSQIGLLENGKRIPTHQILQQYSIVFNITFDASILPDQYKKDTIQTNIGTEKGSKDSLPVAGLQIELIQQESALKDVEVKIRDIERELQMLNKEKEKKPKELRDYFLYLESNYI
ncbi:MAG: helix-turn-helix transcriptional regulator [Patescibacteria group bacterium]